MTEQEKEMLQVRETKCKTCIYRKSSIFSSQLDRLEGEVKDVHGAYVGYRACHHHDSDDVVCRGFWNRHKGDVLVLRLGWILGQLRFSDRRKESKL